MLVIRLQTPTDNQPAWAVIDKKPADWRQSSWETLLPQARGQHIVLLIPGRDVLLTQTSVNARNQRQLQQAIPYALEDSIADDLEAQHIVWQKRGEASLIDVAIIRRERLQAWVKALQAHNLRPHAILPDIFALPLEQDAITLWQQGEQIWVRTSALAGYTSTSQLLSVLLENMASAREDDGQPVRLRTYSDQEQTWAADNRFEILPETRAEQVMPESLQSGMPLNLLQGLQDANRAQLRQQWRRWKLPAALAVISLLVAAGTVGFDSYRLQQQLEAQDTANLQLFSQLFPEARNVDARGLKNRLDSELARLQGKPTDTGPYNPLPDIAMFAAAASQNGQLEVEEIRTRNNALIVELQADSQQAVETLRSTLEGQLGNPVEMQSSRTADSVKATLTLGGKS